MNTAQLLMAGEPAGQIPTIGYGTYKVAPQDATGLVSCALEVGYRHVDTAQMYRNEREVGVALAQSGLARTDYYLTTKLDNTNHEPAAARDSFARSLDDLQVDYVDLFLIHWPLPTLYGGDFVSTWNTLLEFWRDGRAKAVGVSNFQVHHLETLAANCEILPAVNQIEAHPYLPNNEVHAYGRANDILTQAWSPLARGVILNDPVVVEIAQRLGRTPAQVVLRWALQRGDVVFPKASSRERIISNLDVYGFEIGDADTAAIDALDRGEAGRQGSHPDTMDRLG